MFRENGSVRQVNFNYGTPITGVQDAQDAVINQVTMLLLWRYKKFSGSHRPS
jgi:hypothetical protein